MSIDRRLADGWRVDTAAEDAALMRRADGLTCRAAFIHTSTGRLFGVTHEPAAQPVTGVVVCPPLYAEALRNQRRELALSWELSARGVAVQRFQYRGSGNSDGDPATVQFDDLVADAVTAARHLMGEAGVTAVSFVGTRVGASVAAAAMCELGQGGSLALWSPVIDMAGYFTELRRAQMIGRLRSGAEVGPGKDGPSDFATAGYIDVVGSPVSHALYESTQDQSLRRLVLAARPEAVLAVQMTRRTQVKSELSQLVDHWNEAGIPSRVTVASYDEAWWFGASGYAEVRVESTGLDVISSTLDVLGGSR